MNKSSYLPASWGDTKPENIQAITTLRSGGLSTGDYAEFNLATHVGDDIATVTANRLKLVNELQLPAEPVWLEQIHSNKVVQIDAATDIRKPPAADASISAVKGVVCAVMTADCLPVFFCNTAGTEVAVAHAGWRGLHAGIISQTVKKMQAAADEILVSFGPAIGPENFEVGEKVFQAFVNKNSLNKTAFVVTSKNHYLCDIYQLARIELQSLGIEKISGGEFCTYDEKHRFYSYRRQQTTGRMASLIWLK